MKISPLRWFVAAQALAIGLVCVANLPSADNPPPAEKKTPPPAAAPAVGPANQALSDALRRQMEAERFVRPFQSFPPGVDLAKELKVSDEQATKMDAIMSRLSQETSQAMQMRTRPAFGENTEARRAEMAQQTEQMAILLERAKNDISAVLTREQIARAEQIELQSRMRTSGMVRALTGPEATPALRLTPDQVAKLQDAQATAQQEFEKDFDALRAQQRQKLLDARKKVLSVLTPEQQAEYEKLIGDPIAIDDRSLDYGVVGVSARIARDGGGFSRGGGFGSRTRGTFVGGARGQAPGNAAPPAAPAGPTPVPAENKP